MNVWQQVTTLAFLVVLAACGRTTRDPVVREASPIVPSGRSFVVHDTTIALTIDASGIAEPFERSTVSTKLMGTVLAVLVNEGDRVSAGAPLVRIDARDLDAKRRQVQAGIAGAEAMQREASLMAMRMRALYADSAAAKVQLDAAEAGLARADAGVAAAHAGASELDATAGYATVRAPFAGIVTQRHVDPGAFAAPGAPLISMEDDTRLRLAVTTSPSTARWVKRGVQLSASIEGTSVTAVVEGIVPMSTRSLYTINAIVDNRTRGLLSGSSATLAVEAGRRMTILVPTSAIRREGDLVGVTLRRGGGTTRWIKVGRTVGSCVEVLSGLSPGDTIVVPVSPAGSE